MNDSIAPRQSLFDLSAKNGVESQMLQTKSKLSAVLRIWARSQKITQVEMAKMLGTSQPRVSEMLQGNLSNFSIDFLLQALLKLGYSMRFDYNPHDLEDPLSMAIERKNPIDPAGYRASEVLTTLQDECAKADVQLSSQEVHMLIYLCQNVYLRSHGKSLVNESFRAYETGPKLKTLARLLKSIGLMGVVNFGSESDFPVIEENGIPETDEKARECVRVIAMAHKKGLIDWPALTTRGAWMQALKAGKKPKISNEIIALDNVSWDDDMLNRDNDLARLLGK